MELPKSTPDLAIQYEFGVNNLHYEILMEKIILAVQTYQMDNERIGKKLLVALMEKQVKGFCTEVTKACITLKVGKLEELLEITEIRKYLKENIIKLQKEEIFQGMINGSKTNKVMLNDFEYSGRMKEYLGQLDFKDAKSVFMLRYRMIPTKANFPGRWSGVHCNICGQNDTDEHLFRCPGYSDLVTDSISYSMFFNLTGNRNNLKNAASCLTRMIERLEMIQDW